MTFPINCLILGDEPGRTFTVNISDDNQNIISLRKLIKKEIDPGLNHVPVSDLELWEVDFCLQDQRLANFVPDGQPLLPFQTLHMFKDGPNDHIRVIVKVPEGRSPPAEPVITLYYYILGDKRVARITISPNLTIFHLMREIKARRSSSLANVDVDDLKIYKLSEPLPFSSSEPLGLPSTLADCKKVERLDDWVALSAFFPNHSEMERLEIVVDVPPHLFTISPSNSNDRVSQGPQGGLLFAGLSSAVSSGGLIPQCFDAGLLRRLHAQFIQFHAKFWGKSMTQSGLGNEDDRMDVDRSQEEDPDDDLIDGCHFLDIDIENFRYPKIWIRAEYIRIYDRVEAHYKRGSILNNIPPAAVITGQPGSGKSVWRYYALRRCAGDRRDVIWYEAGERFLFTEEGVRLLPQNESWGPTWTLVDTDSAAEEVPSHLIAHGTEHFVIFCTSPKKSRWSRLHKSVLRVLIVMNPWKRNEIIRVRSALPHGMITEESVLEVFDHLSPTPRLCFDYLLHDMIEEYKQEVENEIKALTISKLEQFISSSASLTMDGISHKLCVIRRVEDGIRSYDVAPITLTMQSRLASRFRTLERQEQICLYKRFSKVPDSRSMAGIFFEAAGQQHIQDGVTLEIVPMVRLPSNKGATNPRWYSSHAHIVNASLEASRQDALQKKQLVHIPQSPFMEYRDGPLTIKSDYIYVPEFTNQVALDSFIAIDGLLYVFQFTIGKEHCINTGLIDFLGKCSGVPHEDKWRFIFILPPNQTLVCLQLRNMLGLHPFSAVIEM